MPLLENDKLIKGYYETIKDKYPDLHIDQVEIAIKHAFRYIKSQVEKPNMPTVLIKYFGKMVVYPGKLRRLLKENELKYHKFHNITEEQYDAKKLMLTNKLEEIVKDEELNADLKREKTS